MVVGIDASNIRAGGGLTHLVECLRAVTPERGGFSRVIVWAGRATLGQLDDRPWLQKCTSWWLNGPLPVRAFWQRFLLSRLAAASRCNVLFVPGGSYAGTFRPIVTMSQNLLPFEPRELRRYGRSWMAIKLRLLRLTQSRSFRNSDGVVYLTSYARQVVLDAIGGSPAETAIIPHGIPERFFAAPREQRAIEQHSVQDPFRVLYVSRIDVYKHQEHVVEAIARLRKTGAPISLELIGSAYGPALDRLTDVMDRVDPSRSFVTYVGEVSYEDLDARYAAAGLLLFASSCENLPIILLEGMASGAPIVCSNRGPMPEVLGTNGVYCDPENPEDIARGIRELMASPGLRAYMARAAYDRARQFSWSRCATDLFAFLHRVSERSTAAPSRL